MQFKTKFFITAALIIQLFPSCAIRDKQVKSAITVFKDVNLIPMTDERIIENQTVLIEGKKIVAIGPSSEIDIPSNANILKGAGAYLMPGLADMHVHIKDDWDNWPVFPLNLFLANGVTTIRDFGPVPGSGSSITNALQFALTLRDKVNEGKLIGPTIYTCGLRPGHSDAGDRKPREIVEENHAQGFDFLKIYSFLSKEDYQKAMAAAKELSIYTTGHILYTVGLDGVLSENMDEIAHIEELDWELYDIKRDQNLTEQEWVGYIFFNIMVQQPESFDYNFESFKEHKRKSISITVEKLRSANVSICTTLILSKLIVQKLLEPEVFLARPELEYMPMWYLDAFTLGEDPHQVFAKMLGEGHEGLPIFKYEMDTMWLKELKKASIPLLLGTDSGPGEKGIVPGFSIHDELEIMVENGFSPYEAIASGTINASKVVKAMIGKDDFGTIEKGKRADLILVNKNPLEDVSNIKDFRGVMAAGKWHSKEDLEEMVIRDLQEPSKSGSEVLLKIIEEKGVTAAIEQYWKAKKETPKSGGLDIGEDEMNRLGYDLMEKGKIEEAIVIFKLNVAEYPESYNVYDSLGEAYMKNGNKDLAIENYKKSLEFSPGNTNGIRMLKKLGVDWKEVKVTNEVLKIYIGKYKFNPVLSVNIRVDKNRIFAKATRQDEYEIFPMSETKFYYIIVNAQIEFVADENGEVTKLILYQDEKEMTGKKVK